MVSPSAAAGNAADIARTVKLVWVPDAVLEVRALHVPGRDGGTWAGWFDDADAAVHAIEVLDRRRPKGVYVTLNPVRHDLLARRANRIGRVDRDMALTADSDVLARRWLGLDFDPERASGISSTDEEHGRALERAAQAASWLRGRGWPEPTQGDSGNGGHLLYPVELPNDPAAAALVKGGLEAVALRFGGDGITVDTAVGNAARIWRCYGTANRKGDSTDNRPHRPARLLAVPDKPQRVPPDLLEELAAEAPRPEAVSRSAAGGRPALAVAAFLERHHLAAGESAWQGGTRWVLHTCPFSDAHTDGAYVVQFPNGAIAAGCHHESCTWTWRDLREKFEPPAERGAGARRKERPANPADGLPLVITTDRPLRDITADGLGALLAANEPPNVFQRGTTLVRLRLDDRGAPFIETLSDAALRGRLARVANWQKADPPEQVPPPMDVVRDVYALPEWPLPVLHGIVESPVFGRDGTLITTPGYNPAARLWLHLPPGFAVPDVPPEPSRPEIARAKQILLDDLLCDFPFVNDAARAHALAALLLPFVRPMIAGPTPLHLVDKPTPGSGASLMIDVIATVATGRTADVMTQSDYEEEWRKRITAVLLRAPVYVLIDNLRRTLDSAALSAAITANVWTDRILGHSRVASVPVTCCWCATGNNVRMSNEIARRTVLVRLDPKMDQPWLRNGFRHPDLRRWARENRGDLVWAALTLGQAWIAAGRPEPNVVALGNFEAWTAVIGGILQVAEVPGFLANITDMYARS